MVRYQVTIKGMQLSKVLNALLAVSTENFLKIVLTLIKKNFCAGKISSIRHIKHYFQKLAIVIFSSFPVQCQIDRLQQM